MSLRRDRTHNYGLSNIDFRSKNDIDSLLLFQPWKTNTHFGSMGQSNYFRSFSANKRIFGVTDKINTQKDLASDCPDPRYYTTAQFYKKNKIDLNQRNIYTSDRVAQLDETYKGKERFTGDSMMIVDITKQRQMKKGKKQNEDDNDEKKKMSLQKGIIIDKDNKNKEAIQETQLVKLNVENTLENKVDITKLKEIRLALRRRYANRSNFRKIFKEWDKSSKGEISVYDAHFMINQLSIPINYNETRALIASSNTRNTESLNMEEFIHLIFNDNPALNVDLSKLRVKEENYYNEEEQERLKINMIDNIKEMSKTEELNTLKDYIRARFTKFVRYVNELGGKEGCCDFNTFEQTLNKFQIISSYRKKPLLQAFYDLYKNNEGLLDCKKVIEGLLDNPAKDYFSETKDNILEKAKENIIVSEKELNKKKMANTNGFLINKKKTLDLDAQIEDNRKRKLQLAKEENKYLTEINGSVPSTAFIHKVFDNRAQHYFKLNQVEMTFSPHPSLIKESQRKTRFSANPKYRNTGEIMYGDISCPTYITEKDRFNVRGNVFPEMVNKEQLKKKMIREGRLERIRKNNIKADNLNYWKDYLIEEKKDYSQLQRSKMAYNYETIIKNNNKIIE